MYGLAFLQDLAVVMAVAGLVTLLFHRLKQPVVLGYLLAGFIIGPYTPPFPLIRDELTIRTLADLGVIVLMFSLGLEFSLRTLREVGRSAFIVAAVEITLMVLVGYEVALLLGWPPGDRLLLGIMLALTSTTIVVKSLRDRGELNAPHGRLISGVAIYDDIFVILVMVLLPGIARTGSLPTGQLLVTLLGLFVFLVAATVVGLLVVPRLIRFVSRFRSDEMLLVLALGLCFGMSLLALKLQFSPALGAFLMGGILAETREHGRIGTLIAPIRDMFSAIFFVSIGMLIDPRQVLEHGGTILLITAVYLVTKVAACAWGGLVAGLTGREAIRVGTGMAQVGEFAFILATIAASLHLTSDFLPPVIVAVATLNAVLRPYLVDHSDRLADALGRIMPGPLRAVATVYARWLVEARQGPGLSPARRVVRTVLSQIALNLALIAAAFLAAAFFARLPLPARLHLPAALGGARSVYWLAAAVLCLPVFVATARKIQATAMMLADLTLPADNPRLAAARGVVTHILAGLGLAGLLLFTLLVSLPLLPPWPILTLLGVLLAVVILRHGQQLNRFYSLAKGTLVDNWEQGPGPAPAETPPLPAALRDAHLATVTLPAGHRPTLLRELALRTRTGASVVAIERQGVSRVNPGPDEELLAGDQLLVLGSPAQLDQARALLAAAPAP